MKMKKTIIAGLAAAGLITATALPALADNGKGSLYVNPAWSCANGATSTNTPVDGFANINPQGDKVGVEYALKGAQPNEKYYLYLSDQSCHFQFVGSLTTNGQGNGNGHIAVPQIQGATNYWVYAYNHNFTQYLLTPAVPVP